MASGAHECQANLSKGTLETPYQLPNDNSGVPETTIDLFQNVSMRSLFDLIKRSQQSPFAIGDRSWYFQRCLEGPGVTDFASEVLGSSKDDYP